MAAATREHEKDQANWKYLGINKSELEEEKETRKGNEKTEQKQSWGCANWQFVENGAASPKAEAENENRKKRQGKGMGIAIGIKKRDKNGDIRHIPRTRMNIIPIQKLTILIASTEKHYQKIGLLYVAITWKVIGSENGKESEFFLQNRKSLCECICLLLQRNYHRSLPYICLPIILSESREMWRTSGRGSRIL